MKTCTKCKESKNLEQFHFKDRSKNILQSWCKSCHVAYQNNKYKTDPAFNKWRNAGNKRLKDLSRAFINAYKTEKGCSKCGWNLNPVALDLHHVDDSKEQAVSKMMGMSLTNIKNEVAKCVVLCANCHRIHHHC